MTESIPVSVRLTRPDAATLRELYVRDGKTLADLGVRFNAAPQTMLNWLNAAGVATRPGARADIDDDEVRRLYADEGYTAAEVAARLGCATSTVYHRLARMGVPRRPPVPRRQINPGTATLRRLYIDDGLSLRQIGGRHGVSPQAVEGWLQSAGIARRAPGAQAPTWDADEPVALYRDGWGAPRIARHLGCSTPTVYQRLQAAGVPRRVATPSIGRDQLDDGLAQGLSATEMAAAHGVSVSCVCRALAREGLTTASQAARQHRARWQT